MKNHLTPLLIFLLTITSILILSDNFLFQTNKAVCETENSNKAGEENEYVSEDGMVYLENDMDIIELIKAVSEINKPEQQEQKPEDNNN